MKRKLFWLVVVFLSVFLLFSTRSGFVKSGKAQYYGGCYVCAWDNVGQKYECKMTDGAGGAFCGTTGEEQDAG